MHIGAAMSRRQGSISKLARAYNAHCATLRGMIAKHVAPLNAVAPLEINVEGLFKLDVDHDIWQDLGFNDGSVEAPRWMADENVRNGIRHILELDRCEEELARLRYERCALQEWFTAEWNSVRLAHTKSKSYSQSSYA